MIDVLYISAYQYSGSTLTSFLLNTHPDITSLGHTAGWPFNPDEEFYCSCGLLIQECDFYNHLRETFSNNNLPFQFHNFGAAFKLSRNARINRYLTASLPLIESSRLEHWRDSLLASIPGFRNRLRQQNKANELLIKTAIEYHQSKIYLDNSLDPFRLRHLHNIDNLALKNIHLIRNPRGVAASCLRHRNWPPELTIKLWLRHQRDIVRVSAEVPDNLVVHYDDICIETDKSLARLHQFANVRPVPFGGDFKDSVHHILGNQMRLGDGKIRLDTRWQSELTDSQLLQINTDLKQFLASADGKSYLPMLERYLQ